MSTEKKRALIEMYHPELSISRQCELLGLARSSLYYNPSAPGSYNDLLMRLIDEQYTHTPFYGVPRMTAWLVRQGHPVNHKRIRRLMRLMGLAAIYPKPRLSASQKEHRRFPYLLKGIDITEPDHVWCTDITYIRMRRGFIYLMAIMDWYSRYVLSWEVSLTLESDFCIKGLERALKGAQPEIFNSDQGSQFTSADFLNCLEQRDIRISMDSRGRVYDNIFIERLWRSVKYEEVYLNDYESVREGLASLSRYFEFYNNERVHQGLNYETPAGVYFGQKGERKPNNNLVSTCPMGQVLVGVSPLA